MRPSNTAPMRHANTMNAVNVVFMRSIPYDFALFRLYGNGREKHRLTLYPPHRTIARHCGTPALIIRDYWRCQVMVFLRGVSGPSRCDTKPQKLKSATPAARK